MTKRTTGGGATPPGVSPEQHITVASTLGASAPDVKKLLEQIEDLKEQLQLSEQQRSEAEAAALAAAEAQGALMQREIQEVATGKTVKVRRAVDPKTGKPSYKVVGYKDDGREILKPVFHDFELPTYFYKIDLPPVGGIDLKMNDVSFYHGTVYEFDIDTLRTVKEMVYRLWDHERNISGSNENFYRNPREQRISPRG